MWRIGTDLTDAGFTTSRGKPFHVGNVKYLLKNARYAGLIQHIQPEKHYPGNFPAIVTEDEWRATVAKINDPARKVSPGTKPRWLLSGVAYCGKCGEQTMRVSKSAHGYPTYRCTNNSHLSRKAVDIEDYVNAVVVARLSRPDAAQLFAPVDDVDVDQLRRDRAVVQSKLDGLAGLFADGVLTETSVRAKSAELRKALNDIDARLETSNTSLVSEIASADDIESAWLSLDLERKRLILDALLTVTVLPVGRGWASGLRPEHGTHRTEVTTATVTATRPKHDAGREKSSCGYQWMDNSEYREVRETRLTG